MRKLLLSAFAVFLFYATTSAQTWTQLASGTTVSLLDVSCLNAPIAYICGSNDIVNSSLNKIAAEANAHQEALLMDWMIKERLLSLLSEPHRLAHFKY